MARRQKPGDAEKLLQLFPEATQQSIRLLASAPYPGTILGPPGAGKSVAAFCTHALSSRRSRQLRIINIAAVQPGLISSELFGHARGAFTSAVEAAAGIVEAADQSTLLVEEVGDLPLELQSNLLDVLESGVVRRIGEVGERPVDVRFLFTTNADLPTMVSRGEFRRDLYDRIMWLLIEVPPLSAHPEDIPRLTRYFLRKHGERIGSEVLLAPGASAPLVDYSWPGNVRELELVVARAAMLSANGSVGEEHLAEALEPQRRVPPQGPASGVSKFRYSAPSSEKEERANMTVALVRTRGNVTQAARQLGMGASTFWAKMKVHRLDRTAAKLRAGERLEDIER